MKKIYTLLLLFTITLFYSIPTQAYSLDGNDIDISELNNLTLNELFIDNNIITNGDFSSGSTGWVDLTNSIISNETLILTGISDNVLAFNQLNSSLIPTSSRLYISYQIISDSLVGTFLAGGASLDSVFSTIRTLPKNIGYNSTIQNTNNNNKNLIDFRLPPGATSGTLILDNFIVLNTTALNITSLTKTQLDDYYHIWLDGGYYEYDAVLNDLDMTDFIIISSSFVLWLWFIRFMKGVL